MPSSPTFSRGGDVTDFGFGPGPIYTRLVINLITPEVSERDLQKDLIKTSLVLSLLRYRETEQA